MIHDTTKYNYSNKKKRGGVKQCQKDNFNLGPNGVKYNNAHMKK